jgi:hypothetical protein
VAAIVDGVAERRILHRHDAHIAALVIAAQAGLLQQQPQGQVLRIAMRRDRHLLPRQVGHRSDARTRGGHQSLATRHNTGQQHQAPGCAALGHHIRPRADIGSIE